MYSFIDMTYLYRLYRFKYLYMVVLYGTYSIHMVRKGGLIQCCLGVSFSKMIFNHQNNPRALRLYNKRFLTVQEGLVFGIPGGW